MLRVLIYDKEKIIKGDCVKFIEENLKTENLIWVDIENPDENDVKILSETFKFHPLTVEDCIHKEQRPKVDNYESYYFMILKAFKGKKRQLHYYDIYIFLGKNYLVTLHWEKVNVIDSIYTRVSGNLSIFSRGIDFLLYNLFDAVIDDYFPVTDSIGDQIDQIEEKVIRAPSSHMQEEILILKRNMIKLRKVLSPQREVINILLRHDFDLISEENRMYFMDVYDHVFRIIDLLDSYQDLITGTMDLYMTQISNKTNDIMKILTIITTIIMPLTLITGIYGMNFKFMPELEMKNGYFWALGVMGVIVVIEIIYFKRKKWL